MGWEKSELGEPVNPVPRHVLYGGTVTDDIKTGSQQHGEQGLMSFTFETPQNEAELLVENENIEAKNEPLPDKHGYVIQDDIEFDSPFESSPVKLPAQELPPVVDTEELERQRLRDLENKERTQKMQNKDDKERTQKDEKRKIAREELKKWYAEREKQILRKKEQNLEHEKLLLEKRKTFPSSWKRVGSMIETDDRKDVSRMKSVLIAKKHEN